MSSNNSVTLKTEKSKYLRSFVSSVIFSILSIHFISGSIPVLGYAFTGFFIFSAIASLIPMFPNQSFLNLDVHGFTIRSMFKTAKIKWHEVESFESAKRNMRDTVVYTFVNKGVENRNYMNLENLLGKKEVLPDNYGMKAGELAELMEYYRLRYSVVPVEL